MSNEYQNDFALTPSAGSAGSWLDQEIKMPLDVYKSMCEQSVRTTCERDAYAQKWSQSLIEIEKLRSENARLLEIVDRLAAGDDCEDKEGE